MHANLQVHQFPSEINVSGHLKQLSPQVNETQLHEYVVRKYCLQKINSHILNNIHFQKNINM